jgi:glycosyltransferase involved in cell wall biosynthesis
MKILFVYEHFFPPFDEGVKNFAEQVHNHLAPEHQLKLVRYFHKLPNALNSLLLVPRLLLAGAIFRSQRLIFIPQAALTFSTFIKIFILSLFYGSRLTVIGTQKRTLSEWQQKVVAALRIKPLFVLSSAMAEPLKKMNINSEVLNVGIDRKRYQPVDNKNPLREKYGIPQNKRILLHVGHIRESRNIHWLIDVQKSTNDTQVVLVGSTSTERDDELGQQLADAGIILMKDYLKDIQEVYQMADIYCFPVTLEDAAMETPLSILEAMATNLPVITTAFGRLPEQFAEDEHYRYANSPEEIIAVLNSNFGHNCINREKTEAYTWKATANRLLVTPL